MFNSDWESRQARLTKRPMKETNVQASPAKRIRRDPATTRAMILDATERLMVEEGYAAVSSRRIAQDLGLNAATIHYYYPVTDDIFIALHRRMKDQELAALGAMLAADNPLKALWDFQSNWDQAALGVEFIALANHRKALRPVLAGVTDDARHAQAQALARVAGGMGIDPAVLPPVAMATIVVAIARTLANEECVGITRGHDEVRAFVDRTMRWLSEPRVVADGTDFLPPAQSET
jgi:TetR/AcrR family transcriptional regulator, regulator of autoinduction and epiphytic fitness